MVRGHRAIFQTLFPENEVTSLPSSARKGRSEAHIIKRNELLICRYYYYVRIERKQYIDALKLLEAEFFICVRTIQDILLDNNGILKELVSSKINARDLQCRFTHIAWGKSERNKS